MLQQLGALHPDLCYNLDSEQKKYRVVLLWSLLSAGGWTHIYNVNYTLFCTDYSCDNTQTKTIFLV